jgi:phage baseplate assembly protein W
MAKLWGTNFPFYKGNSLLGTTSKVLPRQEDYRLIRNDYLQGLMTIKGERWFRPDFGGDIPRLQFDPNDISSKTSIEDIIREYTIKYHPMIRISNIEIVDDSNTPNKVSIKIYGKWEVTSAMSDQLLASIVIPATGV